MYAPFFGFNRVPFDRHLSPDQLFRTPALDELHTRLEYLVETRSLGLLTGEPGSGKSTALRRLRDSLHPEKVRAVYLHDTAVNPADFFRQLALELGLEPHWSRALGFRSVQQEIVRLVKERRLTVLLVVDEAHHLRPDLLALLPLLTNFDWDGQDRLARAHSWVEARGLLGTLPSYRRRFTLVATGRQPPEPFLRALGPDLDQLVFVPDPWLSGIPPHRSRLRARHAARLALDHLSDPIQTRDVFADYDVPF